MDKERKARRKDITALILMFLVICDIVFFVVFGNIFVTIVCIILLIVLCFLLWRSLRGQ